MLIAIWTQTVVLVITAVLIYLYTRETSRLGTEAARENRISLRPIIVPDFNAAGPHNLRLKNIGFGCALNVQVMPVRTTRFEGGEIAFGAIETRFEPIEYLAGGESRAVEATLFADGQRTAGGPFDDWFHPRLPSSEDEKMEIRFADVEGGTYRLPIVISAEQNHANLPRKLRLGPIESLP